MEVYFTDRKFNILGMASTSLPGAARLYNDKETDEIESGISTFEGDLVFDDNKEYGNIEEVTNMARRGNYIMFLNRFNQSKFFTIIDTEKNRKDNMINFYAEDAGLDLLNESIGAYAATEAMTIAQYVNRFTNDAGFVIGINEIPNLSRKLSWEGVSTATERLMSVANSFDGAEIYFSFEIKNMQVSKKIINIQKQRGNDTKINLFLGKEIDNIITKESVANLATALFPEGGTPEGKDKPINLAGYKYNDGRYVVTNGGHLLDMEANQEWSRYATNETVGTVEGYIVKRYSYETTSQSELFNRSLSELKKICEPEINFVVDILDLPDNINVGDRVNIIDENDQLFLSARILKLEIEETMDKATATLGDYLIKYSDVDSQLIALAEEVKNIKPGDTYFPSVMYADDDSGNGFNASPRGKSYMAIIYQVNNPIPSEIKTDYNGKWIKIEGSAGAPGENGQTMYIWIKYADTIVGGGMSNDPNGKTYIGIAYNKETATESENPLDYQWSLYKGPKGDEGLMGLQGPSGDQGLPGKTGTDGKTSYTHIAYANNSTGTVGFSTSDSLNKEFIGMYVDFIASDSTNPSLYNWTLIKGADGSNGTPGPKGTDGKTSYLHIAYSNSADGTSGFSTTDSLDKSYIGQYTDFILADSTTPALYNWTLVKGDKGDQGLQGLQGPSGSTGLPGAKGADGRTSYTHIAYANSSNGVTNFSVSDSLNRAYIGMYVDFTEADSTNPALYNWSLIKGADGSQGTAGAKGADGLTPYLHIAYATNATGTTGFSVSDSVGKTYIGQYTDFVEADSVTPSKYAWTLIKGEKGDKGDIGSTGLQGLQGPSGATGLAGAKGADGRTSYTHIAYSNSSNGVTDFSVSDSFNRDYIGMYVDFIEADSTNPALYNWSLIKGANGANGTAGPKGDNGLTPYLHIAYATNSTGTTGFSTTVSEGKTHIGQYTDFVAEDSTVASKYKWTLVKGDKGDQGLQGLQGPTGASGIKGATGADGKSSYTHIAYATNANGTVGFSVSDSLNKTYIGMYVDFIEADSTNPALYNWTLIKGADGSQGTAGVKGADGQTPYLHIAYATNSTGTTGFSINDPSGKTYIGQYTDFVAADSSTPSKYLWTLIKGDKGDQGPQGSQGVQGLQGPTGSSGIAGPKGTDGKTSYTHIAYATNATGTTGFSVSDSVGKTYIGMYTDFTEADSTTPSVYNWTLIKGADGTQGTPGAAGANGQTPYLHIAYSTSSTGSTGFSVTDSIGKTYIGQYTDFVAADSTTPTKYAWTLIKGDTGATGAKGADGISITKVDVMYYLSTSATSQTGGAWVTTAPTWINGRFMWTKTVTTYSNSQTSESSPANVTGASGATGATGGTGSTGAAGKSVSALNEEYYLSTSKTSQAGGSWVTTQPAWADGKYMWTRIKITYTNPAGTEYTLPVVDSSWESIDALKTVVGNMDPSIINANPIFLDWPSTYPVGYTGMSGATLSKVASSNGMGNAVRYVIAAGVQVYLSPTLVTTAPYFEYVTVEFTFKLDSGTIDGAGVLFRYSATANIDVLIKAKDFVTSPVLNKWYTVTKVIKQSISPVGFAGYQIYPMGSYSPLGAQTAKTIQFDSLKTRPSTEQEINSYESGIMIADMSADSKITPVEKVQLKKEWATIASERASLDAIAVTYGITTERTNMTNAYNTLNTVLNGASGILLNMVSTSTVVGTTFRAQFDDYYEKKAILQKRVNELSKTLANNAQAAADTINTKINNAVTTIDGTGITVKDGSFYLQDDTSDTKYSVVAKSNLLRDHSFELIDYNATASDGYGYNTITANVDPIWLWQNVGSPKVYSAKGSNVGDSGMFGLVSAAFNSANYLRQCVPAMLKRQFTGSAFFTKTAQGVGGTPVIILELLTENLATVKFTVSKTFPATVAGAISRYSLIMDVPTSVTISSTDFVRMTIRSGNTNWVFVDGTQLVEGTTPTLYEPETLLFDMMNGVKGSAANSIQTKYAQSDIIRTTTLYVDKFGDDTGWVKIALSNVNSGDLYYRYKAGILNLSGMVDIIGEQRSSILIGYIPTAYAPIRPTWFVATPNPYVTSFPENHSAVWSASTNGAITVQRKSGASQFNVNTNWMV